MSGWIKIDRSIRNNWVWDCEFSYGQAWVDLILNAAHRDGSAMIKSQVIKYKRGDQLRSELTLSTDWRWSRGKVRRFLKNLENDGMIVQQKGHLTTIISICNYDTFQLGLIDSGTTDSTPDGTTDGHLAVHRQECKELKKVKNNNKTDTPLAMLMSMGVDEQLAKDWLKTRKEKKLAPTQTAFNSVEREAKKAGISFNDAVAIAAEEGWGGFKVKWLENIGGNNGKGRGDNQQGHRPRKTTGEINDDWFDGIKNL